MVKSSRLLIIFIIAITFSRQIVDYTLTEDLEKALRDSNAKYNINILTQNIDDQYMTFPQACTINNGLQIHQMIEYTTKSQINNGQLVNNLKTNMTVFLKLQQKLKTLKSQLQCNSFNIIDLQLNLPQNSQKENKIFQNEQIQYLKQIQQILQKLNATIEQKVSTLQNLIIFEINRTTNNNAFNKVRLNFEHVAYEARLKYLQDIKRNNGIIPQDKENSKEKKIAQYFEDIKFQNQNQNKQLVQLNNLLQKYAIISQIKLRISNEMKKLQAKNFTIQNKLDCQKKILKPINKENHDQIQSIINNLKELKAKQSPNRQHCQGVAIKLQNQLKKVLKVYNYSHICKQGLPQLYKQKEQIQQKLKKLNQKLHNLDYQNNFKKIQSFYSSVQSSQQLLISKIHDFDINEYILNKSLLNIQIYNTKNRLQNIQLQIKNPLDNDVKPFDYQKIKELVKDINEEQAKYCKMRQTYEEEYNKIQSAVQKYQSRSKSNLAYYNEYMQKVEKLKDVQRQFQVIRTWLLMSIA